MSKDKEPRLQLRKREESQRQCSDASLSDWAWETFIKARIPIVRDRLNERNRALFDELSFEEKAHVIAKLIEKGYII